MGVDAEIYFDPGRPFTDADVVSWNWRLIEAMGCGGPDDTKLVRRVDGYDYDTGAPLELATHHRYYGPHYERGPWPEIAGMITWLRLNFPAGKVWYGGDSGDSLPLVDDVLMARNWEHWATHGGIPYRSCGKPLGPVCCGVGTFRNGGCGARDCCYCPVCQKSYWITLDGKGFEPDGFKP